MALINKAKTLDQVFQAFREEPLSIDDLNTFYVESWKARGGKNFKAVVKPLLRNNLHINKHILFVGYKGCGKSTELAFLEKDIRDDFLVINFSVKKELDPIHLNYIELFIITMEKLFDVAKEHNLKIRNSYLEKIQHWLTTKEIKNIKEKYNIGVEAEAGAEGNFGIPYLQKFFYKFRISAKSSRSLKETLKTNIEPKLSELIEHCNDLINEIKLQLDKINKKDLLIIIEDLDKLPLDRAEELFFNYTSILTEIKTNVIYTFPIAIFHHVRFNTIRNYFTSLYELPMIKVKNKDGSENKTGIDIMHKIVEQRMDLSLFEDKDLLYKLIKTCGGVIRDLFRMISDATETAMSYEAKKLTNDHITQGINYLKHEYENNIGDYKVDDTLYSAENYYKTLIKLAKSKSKKLDNTTEELHLRQNLSILGYNGEGWYDLHPIIYQILKERNKI